LARRAGVSRSASLGAPEWHPHPQLIAFRDTATAASPQAQKDERDGGDQGLTSGVERHPKVVYKH